MKIPRRFATGRPSEWGARVRGAFRAADRRFAAIALGVFLVTTIGGYAIAALVLFPAPIFAESTAIPNVRGLSAEAAGERLAHGGFRLADGDRVQHPDVPEGAVAWQDPPPGVLAPAGTDVRVFVSAGPQLIAVPDVAGYDVQLARTLLEAAGLVVSNVETAPAPTPANVAVNTRPPAGSTLLPGTGVTLVVSVGRATIRVPTLIGRTLDEARRMIDSAGLALGDYTLHTDPSVEPGIVIEQRPAAGILAAPGATVRLVISRLQNP